MSDQPNYEDIGRKQKDLVRVWMVLEMAMAAQDYQNATQLAEACGEALELADTSPEAVIPEDVYAIAAEFFPDN
jgi:hypothetical protein